jgi:hypothetical protein
MMFVTRRMNVASVDNLIVDIMGLTTMCRATFIGSAAHITGPLACACSMIAGGPGD